jgi:SAM-dependent methyltransferase
VPSAFDAVADTYDDVRPGYPEPLYDRLLAFAGLSDGARALEVGVGTGKATFPLAQRGVQVHGIEPGPGLAQLAARNLEQFPKITLQTTSFESWQPAGLFDLAYCAQAFHWLDAPTRLERFARSLRPRGVLAIFGNAHQSSEGALRLGLDEAYVEHAPALSAKRGATSWYTERGGPVGSELDASPLFADIDFTVFDWQRVLDSRSYGRLLSTYSDHFALPPAQLASLIQGVQRAIDAQGGSIELRYRAGLFLARRR